jgi:hypothetical protein
MLMREDAAQAQALYEGKDAAGVERPRWLFP